MSNQTLFFHQNETIKIAYKILDHGSQETKNQIPLIMIMGLNGLKEDFQPLSDARERQGLGESQQPLETSMTIEDLAKLVFMLANHVKWKQFHLLGYSMGGMIALTTALNISPGFKIEKLILCSTSSKVTFSKYVEDLKKLDKLSFTPERKRQFILSLLELNFTKEWIEANPKIFAKIVEDEIEFMNRKSHAVIAKQIQVVEKFDAESKINAILIPTLIIHGDKDKVIPVNHGEFIHHIMPSSKFIKLKNAGHLFYIEHQGSVKIINEFLTSKDHSIS
ncbi:8294_t:CDS:2 [Ambispora leptoticha]|uniref:8294_t:CDS:1 n=1 Tax=Ambispora leptoticha TaxID=144679 RepID=A0A9N9FI72_9GLOM|nr:8294_t:CDS:2 [Ambispora leptoticha]